MSLLGGLVILGLSLTHGSFFLTMKTDGDIREQARGLGTRIGLGTTVLAVILLLWVGLTVGKVSVWVGIAVAAVSLLFGIFMNTRGKEGLAFIGTAVTMAAAVATYFLALYPNVMPSTLEGGTSLTIENASSTELTLKIMTGAAVVFTPIVLIYTAWTYWVFRKRISTRNIPAAVKVS
jgi:cytochrome d ubiquinol oxidase subunit II